jgi:hypothetical protein
MEGIMISNWQELTRMTAEEELIIERVRMSGKGISIEGEFDLPPLAKLGMEDQVFVAAFVRSHGSIKQMEQLFGISYPTVKNRLNRIAEKLKFVEITLAEDSSDILAQLERGEITAKEAIERLRK